MHFDIKIPIYNCVCKVVIDDDIIKAINRYGKKHRWENHEYNVHGIAISTGNMKDYYIFYSTDSLNVNIIMHEITHLVDFILDERAIENEGEAKAYLTGYIAEKIFDYVLKKKLLINKWYKPSDEKPNRLLREGDQSSEGTQEGTPKCGDH